MGYRTLMVHADVGASGDGLLWVTADLARMFKARVIGIAASQPMLIMYGDGYMAADVIEQDRVDIEVGTAEAEARFRTALAASGSELEWRSSVGFTVLSDVLAASGRAADLFITGPEATHGMGDDARHAWVGEVVMSIGRPVMIVPPDTAGLDLASVVLAWKDTRETRRAAADALPLLKRAGRVAIVEVADQDELERARARLADVAAWLAHHGVKAAVEALVSAGADASRLDDFAREQKAGLLVAGAYGHTPVHEWVLGGVTRAFVREPGRCVLLSH